MHGGLLHLNASLIRVVCHKATDGRLARSRFQGQGQPTPAIFLMIKQHARGSTVPPSPAASLGSSAFAFHRGHKERMPHMTRDLTGLRRRLAISVRVSPAGLSRVRAQCERQRSSYSWMETDRIRMESDSNSTFYHIFTPIQIQIRCSRIRIQIEYQYKLDVSFGYLLDLEHNIYQFSLLKIYIKIKVLVHNIDHSLRISHFSIFILIINYIMNKIVNNTIFKYIYIHTFAKGIIKNIRKTHRYINKLH
jgi:hypothetical protein